MVVPRAVDHPVQWGELAEVTAMVCVQPPSSLQRPIQDKDPITRSLRLIKVIPAELTLLALFLDNKNARSGNSSRPRNKAQGSLHDMLKLVIASSHKTKAT